MTKEEIYSELERRGAKPAKACRFCNIDDLKAALDTLNAGNSDNTGSDKQNGAEENGGVQNKGNEPNAGEGNDTDKQSGEDHQEQNGDQNVQKNTPSTEDDKNEQAAAIPFLRFDHSGWCEELKCSYRRGVYHPRSMTEYNALRGYAIKE